MFFCSLGHVNNLRAMRQGRATFTMSFDHYAVVPQAFDDDPRFRRAIGMRA
jgi:translation elongation factor EF-G